MKNLLFGKRLIILVGVLLTVAAAPVGILALNQYMGAEATTETVDYAKLKKLIDPNRGKDPVKLNANDKLTIPTDAKSGVSYQLESLHIDTATGAATTVSEGVIRLYPPATNAHDNKSVLGNNDMAIYRGTDYDLALNATDDGFASYIVILNEDAPTSYDFAFDMPSGYKLREDGNGGIEALNDDGDVVGVITAPWAVDADGEAVRTSYKLSGSAIVQTIQHSGAAYPVVADPSITYGAHIYIWYDMDEINTAQASYGLYQSLAALGTCGSIALTPAPYAGVLCGLFYLYWGANGADTVGDAIEELPNNPPDDCQLVLVYSYLFGLMGRVEHSACGTNYSERVAESLSWQEIWDLLW